MQKLKKLPIGIQTFKEIITNNYLYIDKSKEALELVKDYKYAFLSRPRRFGKSLFLDTIKNIFEGNKGLFKDLYIYDKWDFDIKYPVIKIGFSGDLRSGEALKKNILSILKSNQKKLDVKCDDIGDFGICFKELIENTYEKYNQKVVVLVDEYDKAILDNLDQMEIAYENREIIKSLYTILKDCDAYIRFVFLTGVSKFSKASIFSGLNMLSDISLNKKYGNICGYTQNDIETTIQPYLKDVDLKKLKRWYNGYNFLKDDMYNPFDILLFIDNDFLYKSYWFTTGTPTYLIKLIKENDYFIPNLLDLIIEEEMLESFDIDNINIEVILYQAGYLTINKMIIDELLESISYKLKVPNKEVQVSLNDLMIRYLTKQNNSNKDKVSILQALKSANLEKFKQAIITIFDNISYYNYKDNIIQNYEGYYASVFFAYLFSLGVKMIAEDTRNRGRIDLTVFVDDIIYIIEFKIDKIKGSALKQIKDKKYANAYLNQNKDIYLVGVEFGSEARNVTKFEWEKIGG